jgi:hypothetical protein
LFEQAPQQPASLSSVKFLKRMNAIVFKAMTTSMAVPTGYGPNKEHAHACAEQETTVKPQFSKNLRTCHFLS